MVLQDLMVRELRNLPEATLYDILEANNRKINDDLAEGRNDKLLAFWREERQIVVDELVRRKLPLSV